MGPVIKLESIMLNKGDHVRVSTGQARWVVDEVHADGSITATVTQRGQFEPSEVVPYFKVGDLVTHRGIEHRIVFMGFNKRRGLTYFGLSNRISVVTAAELEKIQGCAL